MYLQDRMMKELHSQGKTIDEIVEVLKRAPIHPRIVPAIKAAHALGCDLKIVSDANRFFIETILKHHNLTDYFSEINTNLSYVDEEGKLRIFPFHDFFSSSHGCGLCPPNMCKGVVIERIKATMFAEGKRKIIYLGDGIGDFCPSLKLNEGDYVMPRKNFPLWELICRNSMLIKADVHDWCDGEELEQVLLQIINTIISNEESNQLIPVDCKFQTIPMAAPESLPRPLPVRH